MTRGFKANVRPGTQAIAVTTSGNSKIGDASTTYVEQRSCPSACRFRAGGGCYAEEGVIGKFVTGPLNQAAADSEFLSNADAALSAAYAEADAIDRMEVIRGRALRLHTVGDCATDDAALVVALAARRYVARGGGPVWTYTHAWRDVQRGSWLDVSVLASCEEAHEVQEARALGYATALVVESFPSERAFDLAGPVDTCSPPSNRGADGPPLTEPDRCAPVRGLRVVPCPQQTRGVACSDCRLCMDADARHHAGVTVGFAIHGTALTVRKAKLALADPDDPDRKRSSRELIPEAEARWMQDVGRLPTTAELARELRMTYGSVAEMRRNLRAAA